MVGEDFELAGTCYELAGTHFMIRKINSNENSGVQMVRNRNNCGIPRNSEQISQPRLKVWYLPDGFANIFSMHKLEQLYCITYDSWDGFYVVHTPQGEVRFHKDEQGLPFINLDKSNKDAAILLVQLVEA